MNPQINYTQQQNVQPQSAQQPYTQIQNAQPQYTQQQYAQTQNTQSQYAPQQYAQQIYPQQPYTPPYCPAQPLAHKTEEQRQKRAEYFSLFALPTLIYAILYTIFLYDNLSGLTMPFFVAATGIYVYYCMKKSQIPWKNGNYAYLAVMLLLGISDTCTGSLQLIIFNNIGICLVLLCMLLHSYCDDSKWTLGKNLTAIFTAIFGAVGSIGEPFLDMGSYHKSPLKKKSKKAVYILIGIAAAIPLLIIVTVLLYFADAVFASFLYSSFTRHLHPETVIDAAFVLLFALFSSYCGMRYLNKRRISSEWDHTGRWEPVVAITILALVSIVYLFFSGIQIIYLFWGKMQLPDGYGYAAYAREGFFQLLFVCLINVALVLFILRFFRESRALKILLTLISACTFIMAASSAYRMILYIQNYHLTFLRILVLWTLAVIAVLLLGIVIQIYKKNFPLYRYGFAAVCLAYLILSFSHPDYLTASYNLAQAETENGSEIDYDYLTHLSSDAAPVIARYQEEWTDEYAKRVSNCFGSIRQYNFSRVRAKKLFHD